MPQMNGTGPDGKGPGTGRSLGKCSDQSSETKRSGLGKGQGKRRRAGSQSILKKSN